MYFFVAPFEDYANNRSPRNGNVTTEDRTTNGAISRFGNYNKEVVENYNQEVVPQASDYTYVILILSQARINSELVYIHNKMACS